MELLRPGGRLSYIVTNKWLKSGYGEPLRAYFARETLLEQIIDFGHAPIFPDADVFPVILVAAKPEGEHASNPDASTRVAVFPREELGSVQIGDFLRERSYAIPSRRFSGQPWALEHPASDAVWEKIRSSKVLLKEYIGTTPFRGVVTGYNPAFIIDTQTKDQLIREDPALN
jgi:hypothetical protein